MAPNSDIASPAFGTILLFTALSMSTVTPPSGTNAVIAMLQKAKRHGQAHGSKQTPVLSVQNRMVTGSAATLDTAALQKAGFRVVIWTVNDAEEMRQLIAQRVDGIISDRPDLLRKELAASNAGSSYLAGFVSEGHRGGRNLRPENTLPAFEAGLDNLMSTLETDTGVTADHVSLISHEQFINPQTCRAADGSDYTTANQVFIKDIAMADAQRRFICDKVFRGPDQKNDLSLSPAAVQFAAEHKLASPYVPTYAEQLFQFAAFYAAYYKEGPGRASPHASDRWHNAEKVRFDLETKIDPRPELAGQTLSPENFVDTLCSAIARSHMESRSDVQSFDYRTLLLTQERFPDIQTVYLLGDLGYVQSSLLPAVLR